MNAPQGRRTSKIAFLLLALFWAGGEPLWSEMAISKEYQVKAVFLFNFAQFVQWPRSAFVRADEPLQIGILGADPFDGFLDDTIKGEKVNGHPLVIHRYASLGDVPKCHILFISRSEARKMADILASLNGKGILTVGDTEGFIKNGGIVRFFTDDKRIHLRINPQAAKRAKLKISSQVLRLAELTKPGED